MKASPILLALALFATDGCIRAAEPRESVAVALAARHVSLDGAVNFRDLGGYQAADGKRVRWGMLYRSDALDTLSPADWRRLEGLGIARITDFRNSKEIAVRPDRLPPTLAERTAHLPLDYTAPTSRTTAARAADREPRDASGFDATLMSYYPRMVRESRDEYSSWLKSLLEDSPPGAHIFHCTGGRDRTGIAAVLLLTALGVSREQVFEDFTLSNRYLYVRSTDGTGWVERRSGASVDSDLLLQAAYLDAAFDAIIADYGSFDAYLRKGLGMDDAMRRRLRDKFLE